MSSLLLRRTLVPTVSSNSNQLAFLHIVIHQLGQVNHVKLPRAVIKILTVNCVFLPSGNDAYSNDSLSMTHIFIDSDVKG